MYAPYPVYFTCQRMKLFNDHKGELSVQLHIAIISKHPGDFKGNAEKDVEIVKNKY